MIALPIYLQMVLEYNALQAGLSIGPLSLSMFGMALLAGNLGGKPAPEQHHPAGVPAPHRRVAAPPADRASRRLRLVPPGPTGDREIRAWVAGLPAQQLHPGPDLGGAGQRGRRRELGRRVVRALVRAGLRRRHHAGNPLQLQELLAGQPEQVQDEIVRINTDARPLALQVALLVPILAGVAGLLNSFRMMRLPEIKPSGSVEGMTLVTGAARSSQRMGRWGMAVSWWARGARVPVGTGSGDGPAACPCGAAARPSPWATPAALGRPTRARRAGRTTG